MRNCYLWSKLILASAFLLGTHAMDAQMGKCKGKYLGNVIQNSVRADYNTYWNQATSENGSKWGSVETSQGVYNFTTSDVAYNWAKNNNGLFKYHNFVWGSQMPSYVSGASVSTLTQSVQNYITAVANHYNPMGGLKMIDVVNEPVHTALPTNYKDALTAGYQQANPGGTDPYGWIIWAFQLARKNFPNAKLLINEYSIENDPNGALVTYAAMVNAVKNAPNLTDGQKNLIDGIGLQCHAFSINNLSAANFKAALDKLYTLTGVPIHITEMDLDANPNETAQKNQYQALFTVAWEHPQVAGITLWGYVQGLTWRNGNGVVGSGGTDSGILYAAGGERPALTWIKTYMASQPDLTGCPLPGTEGPGWPLPVSLLDFKGSKNGVLNQLTWTIGTEINNHYFNIEQSSDGINFHTIGRVESDGNSMASQTYFFTDEHPLNGITYYRLQQVDINGTFAYSNTITVADPVSDITIAPNPNQGNFSILGSPFVQGYQLEISNTLGSVVYKKSGTSLPETFELQHLGKGIYQVKLMIDNQVILKKLELF